MTFPGPAGPRPPIPVPGPPSPRAAAESRPDAALGLLANLGPRSRARESERTERREARPRATCHLARNLGTARSGWERRPVSLEPSAPGVFSAFCAVRPRARPERVARVTVPGPQIRRPRGRPGARGQGRTPPRCPGPPPRAAPGPAPPLGAGPGRDRPRHSSGSAPRRAGPRCAALRAIATLGVGEGLSAPDLLEIRPGTKWKLKSAVGSLLTPLLQLYFVLRWFRTKDKA